MLQTRHGYISKVYQSKQSSKSMTIYSIFAGRQNVMSLQMPYIRSLLRDGTVDELHLWDYTCMQKNENNTDKMWLRSKDVWKTELSNQIYLIVPSHCDWLLYYQFYAQHLKDNDLLLKVDDDIIYIHLERVSRFLEVARHFTDVFLWSANVINNGKIAALHELDGVPTGVNMTMEMNRGSFFFTPPAVGQVFKNATVGRKLHRLFLQNPLPFFQPPRDKLIRKIQSRLSINFIAILGRHLSRAATLVQEAAKWADEHGITYLASVQYDLSLMVYMPLVVSHASFASQNISAQIVELYNKPETKAKLQQQEAAAVARDKNGKNHINDLSQLKLPTIPNE